MYSCFVIVNVLQRCFCNFFESFFCEKCLMALCVWIEKKLNKPIERKTCGDVMLDEIDKAKSEEGGAKE